MRHISLFGRALTGNLWVGRHYRSEARGQLVQDGGTTRYIPRGLGLRAQGSLARAGVWRAWHSIMRHPGKAGLQPPPAAVFGSLGGAGMSPIVSLLTLKLEGNVVIRGTGDEGVNLKLEGASVISGGTGAVTLELEDVEVV